MTTNQIISENNSKLLNKLIPSKELPIYGNSFTNPKDEVFNEKIKSNE